MTKDRPLHGKRILIFVGKDYEDLELWYPYLRLQEAGAEVVMAGEEQAGKHYPGKNGYPAVSEACVDDLHSRDFAGVICPGGWMPDKLRRNAKILQLVREFHESGKLVAAICHGGWIPISAGVYRGVKVTGSPGIKDDLINARNHLAHALHIDRALARIQRELSRKPAATRKPARRKTAGKSRASKAAAKKTGN